MALCAKLLAEGVTVYAVTHPGSARAALLPQDARLHVVPCDAAELAALPELIPEKADAFFHFAWAHTIGPDILVPGLILADNAVQLRVTDGNAHTAVRLGRLIKIHVQNRADDIIA